MFDGHSYGTSSLYQESMAQFQVTKPDQILFTFILLSALWIHWFMQGYTATTVAVPEEIFLLLAKTVLVKLHKFAGYVHHYKSLPGIYLC